MKQQAKVENLRLHLLEGQVIPAHPLALTAQGKLSERHQRALTRYYVAAGAGGIAVGVHTTQFAIREHGLYRPVLELAMQTADEALRNEENDNRPFAKIAGVCGRTAQAMGEVEVAQELGYDAVLLSLGAFRNDPDETILAHCKQVAASIPIIGFYLQPAVGGRVFSFDFWRRFVEIENVIAIKIAPFNRYQTLDVVRATVEAGRKDIALYTGNDDNILLDLLTGFRFSQTDEPRYIVGGLLGQWAVWTSKATTLLQKTKIVRQLPDLNIHWLTLASQITDANAALFDAANGFAGCIAGIHEVLYRQGLLPSIACLDPNEGLSPGQQKEIDRVINAYPTLTDDDFIAAHLEEWLN